MFLKIKNNYFYKALYLVLCCNYNLFYKLSICSHKFFKNTSFLSNYNVYYFIFDQLKYIYFIIYLKNFLLFYEVQKNVLLFFQKYLLGNCCMFCLLNIFSLIYLKRLSFILKSCLFYYKLLIYFFNFFFSYFLNFCLLNP